MHDLWEVFAAAKRGDVALLRAALAAGFDVNAACEYTGTTALLSACEGEQLEAVRLLLQHGANADAQHRDGYSCWGSAHSRAIREALLASGFATVLDVTTEARGSVGRSLVVPRAPISISWERALEGKRLFVEVLRTDFPPTSGEVCVDVTGVSAPARIRPTPNSHVTESLGEGHAQIAMVLTNFTGQLQVRMWTEEVIASSDGPRTFWLPPWTLADRR